MKKLSKPLNVAELDRLDQFLTSRIDDDDEDDTNGNDEGVLDMSELDGLFTALVSGPDMVPPSEWLPAIWGDYEPVWDSQQAFEDIFSLMMRHMNSIADALLEQPEEFEPLFFEREVKGRVFTVVDEWCYGYLRGVDLRQDLWAMNPELVEISLVPIIAFGTDSGAAALEKLRIDEVEEMQQAITPAVRAVHAYWLTQRLVKGRDTPETKTFRHDEPRAGRNDLCPCGSGKKYKKCCLH